MHHLNYAIRKIDSSKFKECFYRLRRKFQQTIKNTYEEKNKNDVYEKIWMTDDDILKMFRQRIEEKYQIYWKMMFMEYRMKNKYISFLWH